MSSVVYLVRSPLQTLSHALFHEDSDAVVLSLEDPPYAGKVLRARNSTHLTEGERLSYEQVLAIILEGNQVVTL